MTWLRRSVLLLTAAVAPVGCAGPGIFTPIPVAPWTAEKLENQYMHKNDFRTPIMPPIREGFPAPLCEDAPTVREVLRAMPPLMRGIPFYIEEFRDDVQVNTERIVDKIDPPRFFPLIGLAQLHHCHWKCTIYFTETIQSDHPFPVKLKKRRVEVMYIDKDHLHQYVGPDSDVQRSITREHTGY